MQYRNMSTFFGVYLAPSDKPILKFMHHYMILIDDSISREGQRRVHSGIDALQRRNMFRMPERMEFQLARVIPNKERDVAGFNVSNFYHSP